MDTTFNTGDRIRVALPTRHLGKPGAVGTVVEVHDQPWPRACVTLDNDPRPEDKRPPDGLMFFDLDELQLESEEPLTGLDLRLAYYRYLAEENGVLDDDTSGCEDAEAILDGEEPCHRYALHTVGGDGTYLYTVETLEEAKEKGVENITDNLYPESPVAIIDLDTGQHWFPNWQKTPWYSQD